MELIYYLSFCKKILKIANAYQCWKMYVLLFLCSRRVALGLDGNQRLNSRADMIIICEFDEQNPGYPVEYSAKHNNQFQSFFLCHLSHFLTCLISTISKYYFYYISTKFGGFLSVPVKLNLFQSELIENSPTHIKRFLR